MRPCLNLATLLRSDTEHAIAAAAKAGFQAVELWVESLEKYLETHTADDLGDLLQTHGLQVAGIGDIESVTFCNPEQFEELKRRCEHLASVANAISCPTLVISASVRPRKVDDTGIIEETESVIGTLLDIVEPHGVNLAFAFRAFDWCAVNSLEQVREALKNYSKKNVGYALDTFDLHASGVQPETLKSIDPSQIFILRLSDCENVSPAILSDADRVLPGEGTANLDAMMNAFAEAGYTGDVSLKILSQRIWNNDMNEAAEVIMAVTKKYMPGARPGTEAGK
jgi:sugar phosphate isomerase/epimerase